MADSPFRFRLSTVFAAMLLASVLAAAIWAWPSIIGLFVMVSLMCLALTVLIVLVAIGAGHVRFFAIGALVPMGIVGLSFSWFLVFYAADSLDFDELRAAFGWLFGIAGVLAVLCGAVACLTRRLLIREAPRK